ncbi:MAG TPA: RNA 2',3'-cyclic phosphodiesterase [Pyrinomonadaceae bacterium]|nr:RNA 2',3'-cyclic phosphodiesterase [Pyrinomonadaceae bacterium]
MKKDSESGWRIFCAIEFPVELVKRVEQHIAQLREIAPDATASWSRSFHLTVKFIGDTPSSNIDRISRAAERASAGVGAFDVVISGAGAFPKSGSAKVLWIGIGDPTGKLGALHSTLDQECAKAGITKEDRSFHPHLTIARLRRLQGASELTNAHKELGFDEFIVSIKELLVIRSELSSAGSRYTTLSRHSL